MKFTPLPLEGVYEIDLKIMEDERGFFARMYCDEEFANRQLNISWVQMNLSFNRNSRTIRGLHFQRGSAADIKLVRCLRGSARDVIVDMRGTSRTFGQCCWVELNAGRRNAIYFLMDLLTVFKPWKMTRNYNIFTLAPMRRSTRAA